MAKKLFALEDISSLNDERVIAKFNSADAEAQSLHSEDDMLSEAGNILINTADLQDIAADGIANGGLSEDAARGSEVAIEHFRNRLNYKKNVVPALEGFSLESTKIESTKKLYANLKLLRKNLAPRIGIAQEGFFDRIKNAVSRTFTSMEEIGENIQRYSDIYDKETISPTAFKDPAWGRIFAIRGKYKISPHDVNKELSDLQHAVNGELVTLLKRGVSILRDSRNQVIEGENYAYSTQVKAIIQLGVDARKLYDEFIDTYNTGGKEGDVTIDALDRSNKRELVAKVKDLAANRLFTAAYEDFSAAVYANKRIITAWSNYYVEDDEIEDVYSKVESSTRETEAYDHHLSDTIRSLSLAAEEVIRVDSKLIFGAYRYLKETVGG